MINTDLDTLWQNLKKLKDDSTTDARAKLNRLIETNDLVPVIDSTESVMPSPIRISPKQNPLNLESVHLQT